MASDVPPRFQLEDLPGVARDAVFGALTRFESARACCVSIGWNAALGAPHLWSSLDFTDTATFAADTRAAHKEERCAVTAAVIAGACAKAGAALRDVTLPQTHEVLQLVPAMAATHPLLRRVALVPDTTRVYMHNGVEAAQAWIRGVSSLLLRAGAPLAELATGACTAGLDADTELLAAKNALALTHLHLGVSERTTAAQLQRLGVALRAHTRTLRDVRLRASHCVTQESFAAMLDALCTCDALVYLQLDCGPFGGTALDGVRAFAGVAEALRATGTLRHLVLKGRIEALFSVA
jgi:hypothetical protein